MLKTEYQLRLLHRCRWLLVVLCICCCCTAKHGTAIAFTNAAIVSTRGGANTAAPTNPSSSYATKPTDNIDEIRYATISTQHAAVTSEASLESKSDNDSSSDNVISTHQQEDPSKVRM
jgi:hypothetical protein